MNDSQVSRYCLRGGKSKNYRNYKISAVFFAMRAEIAVSAGANAFYRDPISLGSRRIANT
jgi:hypothetical protein